MSAPRSILRLPVADACRQVAAHILDHAAAACARLADPADAEALHDFRVCIRRLRSILRQYAPHLDKKLAGQLRKRLGQLADDTNADRDRQVHAAWLGAQLSRRATGALTVTGLRALLDELESNEQHADSPAVASLQQRFAKLEAKLRRRLGQRSRVAPGSGDSFAHVTSRIILEQSQQLRDDLASIASMDDQDAIHRSRLTAKRLRYVIEPIQKRVPGGRAAVRKLKDLQDRLGDLHDLQTLGARIDAAIQRQALAWAKELSSGARAQLPGSCRALAAVTRRMRNDQARRFQRLERRWLGESNRPFFDLVHRLAEGLERPRRSANTDPAPVPPTHSS